MPKSSPPPLPLKQSSRKVVARRATPSIKPPYAWTADADIVLLSNAPEEVTNAVEALEQMSMERRIREWNQKSQSEMIQILKHVNKFCIPWKFVQSSCLLCFNNEGDTYFSGPVYQQYDPRIENQEMVFGPPAEFKDLQICTVDFGTHYVIEYFNNDSVTLVKLESLPFPVCDNELTITHNVPFLDIPRNILNEKSEDSTRLWNSLSTRLQKKFLEACLTFELPWNQIRSERLVICYADGCIWDGLFVPEHSEYVKKLIENPTVYEGTDNPKFINMTIIVGRGWYTLPGNYEITGSNNEYVSLERLPDEELSGWDSE